MATKPEIARAAWERLQAPWLLSQIGASLAHRAQKQPLLAEPDHARRVRLVRAATGTDFDTADKIARYLDLNGLGLSADQREAAESVRGTIDFVSAAFLLRGAIAAQAVARVSFLNGEGDGTGFLISDRLLITNNHVIPSADAAANFMAEFNYEVGLDGRPKPVTRFGFDVAACFITDDRDDLDFTILALGPRLNGNGELGQFGYCGLSDANDKHAVGASANIIQHPDARLKEVVVRNNQVVARGPNTLHYMSDTQGGSSGSPVFNDLWQVIALHHWGVAHRDLTMPDGTPLDRDVNEGIRISGIVAQLRERLAELGAEPRALIEEALRLGGANASPNSSIVQPATGEALMATRSGSGIQTGGQGAITLRIPLEITVRIAGDAGGGFVIGPGAGMPPGPGGPGPMGALGPGSEAVAPDPNYGNRGGYDPNFIEGFSVPMPGLSAEQKNLAAVNRLARAGADKTELKYTHYSVKMNTRRRLAFFSVANIDGATWKNINRKTGTVSAGEARYSDDDISEGEAREIWYVDKRIDDSEQTSQDLYDNQKIDDKFPGQLKIFERGHLTRRQDPAWGSNKDAIAGDADTFHFCNCAPQIGFFNEGKSNNASEARNGVGESGNLYWRAIENFVLDNAKADKLRVCVFTGPVLDDANDIPWRQDLFPGFLVPREFWKIVVWAEGGVLHAAALCADQSELIKDLPEGRMEAYQDTTRVTKYQISVGDLEHKTGLDFGDELRAADTLGRGKGGPAKSLSDVALNAPRGRRGNTARKSATGRGRGRKSAGSGNGRKSARKAIAKRGRKSTRRKSETP